MARLQILQLPKGAGDDRPPFVLVVDQYQPLRYMQGIGQDEPEVVDEFEGVAEKIGARGVLVFWEPVEIPGNDVLLVANDVAEGDQTEQIVNAHERTRLELCTALAVSPATTWRALVDEAADQRGKKESFFRQIDRVRKLPNYPPVGGLPEDTSFLHGYAAGVGAAQRAARSERTQAAEGYTGEEDE